MNYSEQKHQPSIRGLDVSLEEASQLHGHKCPGMTLGYKAARMALKALKPAPGHPLLVTIRETCRCPVDGVKAVTGCSEEAGSLVVIHSEDYTFDFLDQATGESITVQLLPGFDIGGLDPEWESVRKFLGPEQATAEERKLFDPVNDRVCQAMLDLPDEAMFRIVARSPAK